MGHPQVVVPVNESDYFPDLLPKNTTNIPLYVLIYVIVYGCAAVFGTFGNALVVLTMLSSKVLRQSQNAFIVSLAMADFMVSSVTMPASITGVLLGKTWYEERTALCAFTSVVCAPGCVASMYSILSIAVSRFYYIGQYPKFVLYFSRIRIVIYIFGIWLLSFFVHLPNHFGWGKPRYSFMLRFCSVDTDLLSYAWFYAFVILFAVCITFIFYLRIYLFLRKTKLPKFLITGHKRVSPGSQLNLILNDELKLVKTSFKIFLLFFVTWSPLSILFLLQFGDRVPPWVYLYAALMAHCNSTLNFIAYFLENETFRKALKECILKVFGKQAKGRTVTGTSKSVSVRHTHVAAARNNAECF